MKNFKKKILGFVLILCCLIVTGCSRTITYKTMKDKIKEKESFVVLVIQNGCSHCENFQPVFDKFANDNGIEYVKLNLTNIQNIDRNDLNQNYNISGTPTLLIFKDGLEVNDLRIEGETSVSNLKKVFKKAGYIK